MRAHSLRGTLYLTSQPSYATRRNFAGFFISLPAFFLPRNFYTSRLLSYTIVSAVNNLISILAEVIFQDSMRFVFS